MSNTTWVFWLLKTFLVFLAGAIYWELYWQSLIVRSDENRIDQLLFFHSIYAGASVGFILLIIKVRLYNNAILASS